MRARLIVSIVILVGGLGGATDAKVLFAGERKLNNLVSELLEVSAIAKSSQPFTFTRSSDGWIFISATCAGKGTVGVILDKKSGGDTVLVHDAERGPRGEAMRYVTKGKHTLEVECKGRVSVDKLVVKAIPELIHCGLGFNPEIKAYGLYDLEFLKTDILPNVTTLIVPGSIKLSEPVIDHWHHQGKRFVAEVGINSQGKTAEDHFKYWTGLYEKTPFLDGIIINEFIVNRPVIEWAELTPERRARMDREREDYGVYGEAIKRMRADERYRNKLLYAYVGGSGKKLNQEIIGTNFIRTIAGSGYRIALANLARGDQSLPQQRGSAAPAGHEGSRNQAGVSEHIYLFPLAAIGFTHLVASGWCRT